MKILSKTQETQATDLARSALRGLIEVSKAVTQAHPATVAILVHATAKIAKCFFDEGPPFNTDSRYDQARQINDHLEGICAAAVTLGGAAVIVPLVSNALQSYTPEKNSLSNLILKSV